MTTPKQIAERLLQTSEMASPKTWYPCGCRFSMLSADMTPHEVFDVADFGVSDAGSMEQITANVEHAAAADPENIRKLVQAAQAMAEALYMARSFGCSGAQETMAAALKQWEGG